MSESRELLKDKDYLEKVLSNVSKQHIDICEKYGCEGLWNVSNIKESDKEENTNSNVIFVDFKRKNK